jgi:hypothetical protein
MGKIPHTPEDHECLLFNSCFLGEGQYSPLEKGVRGNVTDISNSPKQ